MKFQIVAKQSITFIVGLFIMAFGVVLSVKADLGVSPISCIPYIFSLPFPLTLGQTTIIMNVFLILIQILLLRKNYQIIQLIQLPVVFLFGFFIDLLMNLLSWLEPSNYIWKAIICILGCVVLAVGVFFEVKAKLTYLPGEGVAMAITKTFNFEFGKSKVGVDSTFVVIGIISSLILLGALKGIREGTVLAAILVGYIVRFLNGKIFFLDNFLQLEGDTERKINTSAGSADIPVEKLVITISREYGSGGHEIGVELAKQLGIKFYDKELIKLSAEKSGFTEDYIYEHEQKLAHSLWYHLYEQNYAYINERKPPLNILYLVQSQVIRDISEKESCVIIGRCANYVLKNNPGTFNIFIHADKDFRKERIALNNTISPEKAEAEIVKIDRERALYCKEFTSKDWGDLREYHLIINTSAFGISQSVQLIIDAVNNFKKAISH